MTQKEFCRFYHISLTTCQKLIRSRAISYSRKNGIDSERFLSDLQNRTDQFGSSAPILQFYGCSLNCNNQMQTDPQDLREFWEVEIASWPDLLDLDSVSKITGYSHETIRRWAASGNLRNVIVAGRCRIAKEWLLEFITGRSFATIGRKSETHLSALAQYQYEQYNKKNKS